MTILSVIQNRRITEVLHFTTNRGLLGVLDRKALLPRAQLGKESRLEYILKNNCDIRRDGLWVNHNSLSVTKINGRFFDYSRGIHRGDTSLWWAILAFAPEVLAHDDVEFCTGNNIWPRVLRSGGVDGFERMFAASVPGTYNSTIFRSRSLGDSETTSDQAEVLYPGALSIDHLTAVYFAEQEHADMFVAQATTLRTELPSCSIIVNANQFEASR